MTIRLQRILGCLALAATFGQVGTSSAPAAEDGSADDPARPSVHGMITAWIDYVLEDVVL